MMVSSALLVAALRLGAPFTDGMVLQRGVRVPVWGVADPKTRVAVSFAGQTAEADVGADGRWRVDLSPLEASGEGRKMTVSCGDRTTAVSDVLVGEVWLAAGQSNMGIPFWGESPRARDRLGGAFGQIIRRPLVRIANLDGAAAKTPQRDERVSWRKVEPSFLLSGEAKAVSTYYGLILYESLGVPVGILCAQVGATCIETWLPEGAPTLTTQRRLNQPQQQPSRLYNGKIAPVAPYALKGVVWYQGESNVSTNGIPLYRGQLHALRDGLAKRFENSGLRFYLAQLAPWGNALVPQMQEEQAKFAAEEPNAGLAVICDSGNLHDIHPNDKQVVALRLALLALKRDYGFDIVADSPTLKAWRIENGRFVMSFDNVREWSIYDPDWCHFSKPENTATLGFEVAGADGVWHPARIGNLRRLEGSDHTEYRGQIDGRELTVWSDEVAEPKRLRYLHTRPWFGRLYNEVGLPVGPFHIN